MVQDYSKEVGLLRTVVRGMVAHDLRADEIIYQCLRAERMNRAHPVGDKMVVLNRAATSGFDHLSESLVMRSSAMERGATYKSVRSELMNVLASYVGFDADTLNADTVATVLKHLQQWFAQRAASRQVFIPCAISPWDAERFAIGPVLFIYMDSVVRSEFYPSRNNVVNRDAFDAMLASMKKSRAHWLACVSVEHCDRERGEEIGALV